MEVALFAIFALLALGSAVVVIAHRNPVYSTISLVLTLVSVAALFVLLGAPFIAVLQVLIYTGAIVVLFLFVIMLLNVQREGAAPAGGRGQKWGAVLAASAFAGMLGMLLWRAYSERDTPPVDTALVSLPDLARRLFSEYMLPFQMIGLLLLAAVIGATVLARRPEAGEGGERR